MEDVIEAPPAAGCVRSGTAAAAFAASRAASGGVSASGGKRARRARAAPAREAQSSSSSEQLPMSQAALRAEAQAWRRVKEAFEGAAPPECLAAWRIGVEIDARIAAGGIDGVQQLFSEWDLDADGSLSRSEFTQACHKLGLVAAADAPLAVNVLFSLFDVDAGDSIDLDEFDRGLETLKTQAAAAEELKNAFDWELGTLQAHIDVCVHAAEKTAAFDAACTELQRMVCSPSIERRVGEGLMACRAKPENLWSEWVRNSDGRLELQAQGTYAVGERRRAQQALQQILRKLPRVLLQREVVDGLRAVVPEADEVELVALVGQFGQFGAAGGDAAAGRSRYIELATLERELERLKAVAVKESGATRTGRAQRHVLRAAALKAQDSVKAARANAEAERAARDALAVHFEKARQVASTMTAKAIDDANAARRSMEQKVAKDTARVFRQVRSDEAHTRPNARAHTPTAHIASTCEARGGPNT